jgi:AraC-like DNA-binding protein
MSNTTIHIKNMVCPRCIKAVETTLTRFRISYSEVKLGEVILNKNLGSDERNELSENLKNQGFEMLDDKKSQLIEKIKNSIIEIVHHQDDPHKIGHLSDQLPRLLGHSYSYLSSFFSEMEGITIEKYLILQKIEKAKELLSYSEMNVSEISYQLNYSSSQHLSRQFKSITGMSPSEFSKEKSTERKPLTDIK